MDPNVTKLKKKIFLFLLVPLILIVAFVFYEVITYLYLKESCKEKILQEGKELTIYIKSEQSKTKIDSFAGAISQISGVESVNISSAEDNLNKFKEKHANNEVVLEALKKLNTNPLGPSLEVIFKDLDSAANPNSVSEITEIANSQKIEVEQINQVKAEAMKQTLSEIENSSLFLDVTSFFNEYDAVRRVDLKNCSVSDNSKEYAS